MVNILALETSTTACSAALCHGGQTLSNYSEEARSHSTLLLPMIDDLLTRAGLGMPDVDCLAITVGPGSFTGLRIGFGVLQGLAFAHDIPVVGISTLSVLVEKYQRISGAGVGSVIMPIMDARMSQVHCAFIQLNADGSQERLTEDQLIGVEDLSRLINEQRPQVIVGEVSNFEICRNYDSSFGMLPEAQDVLALARIMWAAKQTCPIQSVDLVYMRNRDAWRKHQKLRG